MIISEKSMCWTSVVKQDGSGFQPEGSEYVAPVAYVTEEQGSMLHVTVINESGTKSFMDVPACECVSFHD